jgi:hypothetical protein
MNIPNYIGKTPNEIIGIEFFDSAGYFFKSMAWLDCFTRERNFSPLLYACADSRHGIEYLLFEELVVSTGANLSEEEYRRCVNERNRFVKTIEQLTPDYDCLKRFTKIVARLEPAVPKLIDWDHKALMKAWGLLSRYLHWFGARVLTTQKSDWLDSAYTEIKGVVEPLWINITSGQSGILHPKDMHPTVKVIWERFKIGEIDEEKAKFQLKFLEPINKFT